MTTYLIATEVTFVMLLLVCGSWFVRSFWELTKVDLGFRGQQVIAADLRLLGTAYLSPAQLIQYRNQLLPKLSAVPGVQSVAFASPAPFVGDDSMVQVRLMDGRSVVIGRRRVDPEYFDVLSMALIQGRRFEPSDSTRPVTVITETLAEQLLLGSNAIGKTLAVGNASLVIIGVVGAVRTRRVSETPLPAYYIPWTSQPSASFTVLVRTAPGQNLTAAISDTIANIDRHQPLHAIGSLQDLVADSFGDRRLYAQATIGLALATMILAGAGICGVLIQSISQRRRELGIRLAVGAAPRQLLRAVVAESLKPVVAGAIVGAVASYQTFGAVKHLLFSVDAIDATSFGLAGTCLLVAAVVATWSVGKHLARVDIASALKE